MNPETQWQGGRERGDGKEAQSLVVERPTKKIAEDRCRVARCVHGSEAGDRYGVEPRPDVGREKLVDEHGCKRVPEKSHRLRVLDGPPVEALERLDRGQRAPVDGLDVIDQELPKNPAKSVSKQADGYDAQDDGQGAYIHVIEDLLRSEDLNALGRTGSRCGCDSADGMFLETPGAIIEEGDDPDPARCYACVASCPPSCFQYITPGKNCSPGVPQKVCDEDDKCTADRYLGWFELSCRARHKFG